jgi:hypothetical protein
MTVFLLAIFRLSQFGVISHGQGREAPATEIINKAWITMLQTPTPGTHNKLTTRTSTASPIC